MLNDASGFEKVYIACGRTDLRRGIDGLASIVKYNFKMNPFQKNVLFLFCGRQTTKIKGLVWGRGWVSAFIRKELLFEIISWKAQKLRISKESSRIMMYHWTY